MTFDDHIIDAILWNAIQSSSNPADFSTYLRHHPINAAHLAEAELNQMELAAHTDGEALFPKAVETIRNLADSGDAIALFHMGKFYDNGNGVAREPEEAAKWYERAAHNGEIRACHNLALMKLRGDEIARDIEGGLKLLERAADAGEPLSAEMAADFYRRRKKIDKAISYYQIALANSSQTAGLKLGQLMYWEGEGDPSARKGIELIGSMAEQGSLEAIVALGHVFAEGRTIDRNIPAARTLFEKAIAAGNKEAMVNLGILNINTAPDPDQPNADRLHWLRKAWDNGVISAAGYIGHRYQSGDGIDKSPEAAIEWFKRGVDAGEIQCAHLLGRMYELGEDVKQNDKEAEHWYRKAAEAGLSDSQTSLGRIYMRDMGVPVNGTEAIKWLTAATDQGNAYGMYLLACLYQTGQGVIRNEVAAFEWCLKSAKAGNLDAQSELATMYWKGAGCPQNQAEALVWRKATAEAGRPLDQSLMAAHYFFGEGVEQNYDEANKWAWLAAAQGNATGQSILGDCYLFGCGVAKDREVACSWLRKAAEQGHVSAQSRLAEVFYTEDDQGHRDFAEAARWASLAADQGNRSAQLILGRMFLYGEQVESDAKAATEWFLLAAKQGSVEAQYWLGRLAADGIGIKRDWSEALKWLKRAADGGSEPALVALKNYGIEYTPKRQQKHRLTPEDSLLLDPAFDARLLTGLWISTSEDATVTYAIHPEGAFESTAESSEHGRMNFSGRWALHGVTLIMDIWESEFPLSSEENADDTVVFLSCDELRLKSADGSITIFRKQEEGCQNIGDRGNHEVIQFPKMPMKPLQGGSA